MYYWAHRIWIDILHFIGADDTAGLWYGFWSGFAGDIPIFGMLIVLFRRYNCHVRRCHRFALHQVADTEHYVCRKHHPDLPNKAPTAQQIRDLSNSCSSPDTNQTAGNLPSDHPIKEG